MRRFFRHPTDIPICVRTAIVSKEEQCDMKDLSEGGLSCFLYSLIEVGMIVDITITSIDPPYYGQGKIVWAKLCDDNSATPRYEVGIKFTDNDEMYKVRMVQQICHIEQYRRRILEEEGRELDSNSAAQEWIQLYAADFGRH
ncbi:PilZ domain-containing protein [Marinomonas sp. PE14-40]|uniref:PilZ domain-containing protein n=1 Tax=Marinomonas sp. PE14-40 TaxID=3060621 RepID=UPI003F67DB27